MNGAKYIVEFLRSKGVKVCFGYPGGAVLTLYDELHKENFPHILTRHEQGAAHAAESYARVTGEMGVVIATSGPGATNLVTGIANAWLDSTPIFCITGQVSSGSIGRDAFQEADITGITMPITKHNFLVSDVANLPSALENAWDIALSGRTGPVLVDITKDVFAAEVGDIKLRPLRKLPGADSEPTMPKAEAAAALLNAAKRPLILAGGGVVISGGAPDLLSEIAAGYKIPVATTLMGKGAIDERKPLALGMVGMHGLPAANIALDNCDTLLAVGMRFSDRVLGDPIKFREGRTIIHVDIDEAEISKNIPVDLAITADAGEFLKALLAALKPGGKSHDEWLDLCISKAERFPVIVDKCKNVNPQMLMEVVNKYADEDTAVITDVGQHQMFAAQHYKMQMPRRFVTSGGLGTMGFGLPAAMGAAVGLGKKTVLFVGDGGLQMTIQELATIAHYKLPVKVFVMDNSCLGMVRQWQEMFYDKNYSHSTFDISPDFAALGGAYGIKSLKAANEEELERAVKEAMADDLPTLVHCILAGCENVLPFIPPGGNPHNMIGPGGKTYE